MIIADRVLNIEESKSIGLSALVEELKREGKKIISLNVGEADFPTPPEIIEATKAALEQGQTRYSAVPGVITLRQELANSHNRNEATNLTAQNIIIGHGSKGLLYSLFQTLCNPGDEFIVVRPYWVTFPESIKLAGGVPVIVDSKKNFQLDIEKIKKAITPKTKGILINGPNNPTGAVYPTEDLQELIQIAHHHKIYLVSDEAYKDLIYDNLNSNSLISLHKGDVSPYLISVQTFSKSYFMTGFRIGHLVAHAHLVQAINKLAGHLAGNNCTFAQYGALKALETNRDLLKKMHLTFEARRDLCFKLCEDFLPSSKPQGAFYLFPNIEKYLNSNIKTCTGLAQYILKEAHVAILPGEAFGMPGHLRISFASSEADITQGIAQIKQALLKLTK